MAASTSKYMDQAAFCLASLKDHNPDLPVALMSFDTQAASELPADLLIKPSEDMEFIKYYKEAGRMSSLKTWFLTSKMRLPYEITMYLDIDTFVRRPLGSLFEEFDKSGAYIGYGLNPDVSWQRQDDYSLRPTGLIAPVAQDSHSMNAGILLFRDCPNVYDLFNKLRNRYLELSDAYYSYGTDFVNDQSTMKDVLSGVAKEEIYIFDSLIYNATPFVWKYLAEKGIFENVAIFHGHDLYQKKHLPVESILDENWINNFPYLG